MKPIETPVIPLASGEGEDYQLYVKRDDLLPFSLGGNKVRIAQAFLEDMKVKGCDAMIMYGDTRSNLCRVLANLCAREQIPAYMISTSVHGDGRETANSQIMKWFDVEIISCSKDGIAPVVETTMERLKQEGRKPYYIYGNKFGTGNEGVAARAYAKAYEEICKYEQEQGVHFDLIICPCGTGATYTGLLCGSLQAEDHRKIVGISISRTGDRGQQIIRDGICQYYKDQGLPEPKEEVLNVTVHFQDQYVKGGYGLYDEEIQQEIQKAYVQYGLPLDPVYTGKAWTGMKHYLEEQKKKGQLTDKAKVLFIHTGGSPLFFDYVGGEK